MRLKGEWWTLNMFPCSPWGFIKYFYHMFGNFLKISLHLCPYCSYPIYKVLNINVLNRVRLLEKPCTTIFGKAKEPSYCQKCWLRWNCKHEYEGRFSLRSQQGTYELEVWVIKVVKYIKNQMDKKITLKKNNQQKH